MGVDDGAIELHDTVEAARLRRGIEYDASYYTQIRAMRDDIQAVLDKAEELKTPESETRLLAILIGRCDRVAPDGLYGIVDDTWDAVSDAIG